MGATFVNALLGQDPALLHEGVTLDTALTLPRIEGREAVHAALSAYAKAFGATTADLHLQGEGIESAVFTAAVDGHTAQVLAVAGVDDTGLIRSIHQYGRPWPWMGLVRERLGAIEPDLIDPALGAVPYVTAGPGADRIDPPDLPPLASDVAFVSPLLTEVATGRGINERILAAAGAVYGEQRFRAVLQVVDAPAVAALFDGVVAGNALQLAAIFHLNPAGEVDEIRIFSRPWPVTAYLRAGMYKLLREDLGPRYWQGRDPEEPLPIQP
jgi:hypothetical protein